MMAQYKDLGIKLKTFFFQQMHTHVLEHIAESLHATELLLIPQTSNFTVYLALKTRAVIECDLLPPASASTETVNLQKTKSKFKIAPFKLQYVISVCETF